MTVEWQHRFRQLAYEWLGSDAGTHAVKMPKLCADVAALARATLFVAALAAHDRETVDGAGEAATKFVD